MNTRAWLEMALLGIIWGVVFLAIAVILDEMPVFTIVAFRVGFAALILWAYVLYRGRAIPRGWRVWAAFLVMGMLNNVIPFSLLTFGQTQIEAGLSSILNAGTVVFATLISAMFLKDERLTPRKTLGVILGMTGVITVTGIDSLLTFDMRSLAQIACIGAAISYALAGVWARKTLTGVSPDVSAAGMLTGSTLIIIPLALKFDGMPNLDLSTSTWVWLAFVIVVATVFAYLLYFSILDAAGASNTLLVTLVVPPVAIILGAVVLSERLELQSYIGFALIGLALAVIDGRLWKLARRTFSSA